MVVFGHKYKYSIWLGLMALLASNILHHNDLDAMINVKQKLNS